MASSPDLKRNRHCWSELPQDLLQSVFERLGFTDFEQAKSVCSSWHLASRKSQPNNQLPWLILFPKDHNNCLLFNPENQEKLYKTQDLGNDFADSFFVATYRSWFLMLDPQYRDFVRGKTEDHQYNLYILDLLTRERINLPTLDLEFRLTAPIFWIDEKTKDYLVIGMLYEDHAISFKKGDNSWKQIHQLSSGIEECFNMVYKDHKLYCLNNHKLKIFDFSQESPVQVFKISVLECIKRVLRCPGRLPQHMLHIPLTRVKNNVVVTVNGDALFVSSIRRCMSKIWSFEIYKIDSSKGNNKWEEIFSLGDEAILLDLGITVLAKEGLKKNSIYFNATEFEDEHDENDVFIYSLDTKMVEQPHQFLCSSIPCSNALWFLPSFKRE